MFAWMQTGETLQVAGLVLLPVNTVLLLGVVFQAGQQIQKLKDLKERIDRLPCQGLKGCSESEARS